MDANKTLSETETVTEQISDHIRNCAKLLHQREGEFLTADETITLFSNECEIEKELAAKTLTKLVGDTVDPVIQVNHKGEKLVGVVDFHQYDGAYGYTNFHDQFGKGKRVVCQQCVNESVTDADVTHATEGDMNGSFKDGASWDELVNAIHQHYNNAHSVPPTSVNTSVEATGATLVSGTTIGGGTAVHEGFTNAANISINGDAANGLISVQSEADLPDAYPPPQIAFVQDKNEYQKSTIEKGFAIQNGSFNTSIATQDSFPTGMAFSSSGDTLFEIGSNSDKIYSRPLSNPFDITSAGSVTSIQTQDFRPTGMTFSSSGDTLFEIGSDSNKIYSRPLSSDFDITSAGSVSSIASQDSTPQGMAFSSSGDTLFEIGIGADKIYSRPLSSDFDITTAGSVSSIASQDGTPTGMAFSSSGDTLFEIGVASDKIYSRPLSTAFDITTAGTVTSIAAQDAIPFGMAFSESGDTLFEMGDGSNKIYESTGTFTAQFSPL